MRHIVAPISCVNASNCRASFCRTHSRRGSRVGCVKAQIVAPRHIVTCDITSHPYSCARAGPPQSPDTDRGRLSSACSYATRLASLRETKQNKDEQSKASLAKHGQDREGQPRSATCFAGSFAREGRTGQGRIA